MLLWLLAVSYVVPSVLGQCLTNEDDRYHKDPSAHRELVGSQLELSLSLFKAIGRQQALDNVFISPYSIYNAMLLAYFTSNGHTEDSLHNFLHLAQNKNKLDMMYAYRFHKTLASSGEYRMQVNSANRLFVSVNQTVRDCMTELFYNEIETVDYSPKGLQKAVDSINQWVANQTQNHIQELVSADSISPRTQLVLANAAYFKGTWLNQFDERDTKMRDFHVSKNKVVQVPMMFQMNTFNHWRADNLGAELLEMPYKGVNISLILLLPDETPSADPVGKLLRQLDGHTLVNIIRESTDSKNEDKVELKIPKFNIERTLELTPILEGLGVGDLFKPTADLTGLTEAGGPPIRLSSAIHKAKVQVDEKGTEAAAATALTDTRIPGNEFICDRPFMFLIYDKPRTTLLFAGILNDPTK